MTAETDWQASAGRAIKLLQDVKLAAVGTFATDEDTALTAFGTTPNVSPEAQNAVAILHNAYYSLRGAGTGTITAFMRALAIVKGYPETDPFAIFARYYEDCAEGAVRVNSREITFAAAAAGGSNSGNGTITRLTKDRYAFDIENVSPELKTWECVQDEHNGASRWNEVFRCYGTVAGKYTFPFPGTGLILPGIQALSIRDSTRLIQDPGFDSTFNTTSGFTGWNVGTAWSNITQETTRYYKDVLPNTNAYCLKFTASDYVYQTWSAQSINWNPFVPLYAQLAWMRQASATGTLRLRIGDIEATVDVSTGTNDQWNVLRWPLTAPASTAWMRSWNAQNAAATPGTNPFIKIEMSSLAVGTVLVDDVIVAPYTQFDGAWCAIVPGPTNSATVSGAAIPFLRDDVFTATDSTVVVAILQEWFARSLNAYLPGVAAGAETWADPA